MKAWQGRTFLSGGADSCHSHLLSYPCPAPPAPLRWTDEGITKGPGGQKKPSSAYSLGPGAHDSILQLVKVGLFISKDQHNSLLQAPTPFLSPIFSLSPLSMHLSLSYFFANGKTVLGRILFFQRIQFSFVHTWSDPVTDIKCVFCLIQRARILCADGHSPLTHASASTHTHTHVLTSKKALNYRVTCPRMHM